MSKQRKHQGSQLGFHVATAGSSILGSLWEFSYIMAGNGDELLFPYTNN